MTRAVAAVAVCAALAASACQKVQRHLHETTAMSKLPVSIAGEPHMRAGPRSLPRPLENPYEGNSYAVAEGQRLFEWYNCAGCHFRGGGGIGPALMDPVWIYGKDPADLYESIVEGRPNGMPAWGGKIPEYQVWQLVTYVESLKAGRGIAAPPGPRQEHLQAGEGRYSR
jgi:cytochrome c oxidase cbb3-type subunit 3